MNFIYCTTKSRNSSLKRFSKYDKYYKQQDFNRYSRIQNPFTTKGSQSKRVRASISPKFLRRHYRQAVKYTAAIK